MYPFSSEDPKEVIHRVLVNLRNIKYSQRKITVEAFTTKATSNANAVI